MSRAKWLGMVVSGTALVGATAWAFHATPDVQVESARVTAGPITRSVIAIGTVQPVTTVEVGSQVSGVVQSLEADYNSVVRAGQVVARLAPSSYDAQLREARAALAQTDADVLGFRTAVEDAQAKLARAEALAALQLIPQTDLDDARVATHEATADLHAGEATVLAARAAVDQAAASLEHTIIRSPIDGIVIDRDVDVGEYDGKRFTPIAVHVGLADDEWTELVSGSIRPGDALVTSAVPRPRSRI
jgi:HlyD family secretion protein